MRPIYKVAVIGAGTMGQDLAALMARQKMPVAIKDINPEAVKKAVQNIHKRVDSWAARGKIDEYQAAGLKGLLEVAESWDQLQDEGLLVIEAVPENLELKRKIFAELEKNLPKDAIFSSNTSSLPIAQIAEAAEDKTRVIGMHFFNPPTSMPLVEVIPTADTAPEVRDAVVEFAAGTLQKIPVVVKDRAGFLVNVLLAAYLRPALEAIESERLDIKKLDQKAMNFGWPMGPFALMDKLGLDVCREVMEVLHEAYGKRFPISPILQVLVLAKRLGEKTGAGFYNYGDGENINSVLDRNFARDPSLEEDPTATVFEKMMSRLVNEAATALEEKVASQEDIDFACVAGLGFPKEKGGPLHWADSVGLREIVRHIAHPQPLLKKKADKGEKFFSEW